MSEFDDNALQDLADHLAANGVPRDDAMRLACLNASVPMIDGGRWIIRDSGGAVVARVPVPPLFESSRPQKP
jgi:hypothetical protein